MLTVKLSENSSAEPSRAFCVVIVRHIFSKHYTTCFLLNRAMSQMMHFNLCITIYIHSHQFKFYLFIRLVSFEFQRILKQNCGYNVLSKYGQPNISSDIVFNADSLVCKILKHKTFGSSDMTELAVKIYQRFQTVIYQKKKTRTST